ncbi:MAG: sodium/solute symporter [Deferribacteres bacterium]|nr:sodium/solute symporter [candidate division KSB1 bacterium]MCB9502388.1 sodium/solute symporter [Deferribacteres bacterium]
MKLLRLISTWLLLISTPILIHAGEKNQLNLKWTKLSDLPALTGQSQALGVAGPFTGIANNTLIVAGGANFPQPVWETEKQYFNDIFVLELSSQSDSLRWIKGNFFDQPIAYGASIETPYGLLCMGGRDAEQVFDSVFLLNWDNQENRLTRSELPSLPKPCAHGYAAIIGNTVYLAGGQSGPGLESAMKNFWMLDLTPFQQENDTSTMHWQELPSWPGPERAFNITVAQHNGQENCIYLISGRRLKDAGTEELQYNFLRDVYEFNPSIYKNTQKKQSAWRRRKDVPVCVMAGTGAAIGQSSIFLFGGADGSLIYQVDKLRDRHPGFPKKAWAYHTITDTWIEADSTPVNQVTTRAINWGDKVIIPTGEVRPRRRTADIWQVQLEEKPYEFGLLNSGTLIAYLLSMLLIGFYFARRNKNTDDYFRGGQRVPWWAAACSIFATMLSSITYMAVPARAYATNWEYLLGYPAIFITAAIVVYFILPFFRRIDATSAYEYLEKRFNRLTRLVGSGMFTIFQIGRMAIVMYLSALALATITPFNEVEAILAMGLLSIIYSTMGGVEAVIWTDTIQTFVLLGGALLILFFTLFNIDGGFSTLLSTASEYGKFHMVNWDWDMHSYTTAAFWVLILGSLAQNMISYTSDQAIVQRYMTTSSEKLAKRSIWTNGVMGVLAGLLFFFIGTALFVFYQTHPAHLDPTFKNDSIMPLFIVRELPVGIAGLLVAGIFAAAQSTISTSMNSTASALVVDFIRPFITNKSDGYYLNFSRSFTFCFGLLGTIVAVLLASADIKSLLEQFFAFIGLFGGSLGGLFLLGMFTKRATGRGAFTGAIIGVIVLYLVQSYTDTHLYLYTFVGVSACFVGGYVSSLLLGGAKSDISGLTVFDLKIKK